MKLERLTDQQISDRLENEWDGLDSHGIAVFAVLEQRLADQKALDQAVEEARREERERITKILSGKAYPEEEGIEFWIIGWQVREMVARQLAYQWWHQSNWSKLSENTRVECRENATALLTRISECVKRFREKSSETSDPAQRKQAWLALVDFAGKK